MNLDPWSYAAKTRSEHAEQVALFSWSNMAMRFSPEVANYPQAYNVAGWAVKEQLAAFNSAHANAVIFKPLVQLKWLHAIKNQGHGSAIRGASSKAEGVKAGVFDVFLPVPVLAPSWSLNGEQHEHTKFAGLYIELKRKAAGKPSTEQLDFQTDMRAAGYKAEIIFGWELAKAEILSYLGLVAS